MSEDIHMGLPLEIGQEVPNVNLMTKTEDGMVALNTKEQFAGQRVVLFATAHLPGFDALYSQFVEKGIDAIYCLSVNDTFAMNNWFEQLGIKNVKPLADGNGEFTHKIGAECKKSNLGFGYRSWRYALVLNDGKVEHLFIEEGFEDNIETDPFEVSSAEYVLDSI
jgi:peroxiredoxin